MNCRCASGFATIFDRSNPLPPRFSGVQSPAPLPLWLGPRAVCDTGDGLPQQGPDLTLPPVPRISADGATGQLPPSLSFFRN